MDHTQLPPDPTNARPPDGKSPNSVLTSELAPPVTLQVAAESYRDRLRADVHRAVGGSLNLVRELSRISAEVDPSVPIEWMVKRVQFFAYELETVIDPAFSERNRLAALNTFFFEKKSFRCLTDTYRNADVASGFLLSRVLASRTGSSTVVALLYVLLAEQIGLRLEFVDLKPMVFLRWSENGRARYIDVTRRGATLSDDELIDMLQTRFQMMSLSARNLLETYSFEAFLCEYLLGLRNSLLVENNPAHLLFLQNTLISYQPSNISLLGERALLHRRIGNNKGALADLKRYFAFCSRERAPQEFVQMYDELTRS